jgi:tripartite-type tricarboxylate transporter receptor subunit TctC
MGWLRTGPGAILSGCARILTAVLAALIANGAPVRALATTGSKRSKALPDVPTMEESGFPGFVITPWWCVLAPAKTSPTE